MPMSYEQLIEAAKHFSDEEIRKFGEFVRGRLQNNEKSEKLFENSRLIRRNKRII